MSNLSITTSVFKNVPTINIKIEKDNFLKSTIFKNQVKNNFSDVFLDEAKSEKDKVSFTHGLVIERSLNVAGSEYFNKYNILLDDSDNDIIEYKFTDNNANVLPSISDLTNKSKCKCKYTIKYFSFPTNLIFFNERKKEETIIFEHYKKYKTNISLSKSLTIAKQLNDSKNIQDIDVTFFNIFEKSTSQTIELLLNKIEEDTVNFTSKILYDSENLLYEVSSNKNINNFNISLDKVNIFTTSKDQNIIVDEKLLKNIEIPYDIIKEKAYFNILDSKKYNYYVKNYDNVKIKFFLSIYEKSSNKLVKNKSDIFTMQLL